MYKNLNLIILIFIFFATKSFANFDVKAKTAIIQDYHSGEILFEKEAYLSIYPASMTKIMTSIIAFDLIKSGDLSLDDKFIVSEKAWRLSTAGYSSMFIMVGDEVSVKESNTNKEEALSALEVLGFNKKQAEKALDKIVAAQPESSVEQLIKLALKNL